VAHWNNQRRASIANHCTIVAAQQRSRFASGFQVRRSFRARLMRPQSALQSFLDFPAAERKLGAYRLVHLLGRGGFAPVWLAHEEYDGTVVRTVALKLFSLTDSDKPDDDDSLRERRSLVVKEAESLCRVEHPNIVKFFSLAIHETLPVAGLAMEHAKGGSVAERLWLRGLDATGVEGLPVPEVLSVALAVSSALAAIHEAGLVHQDIKPANVVATSTSFKVIDFGIAAAERVRRFLGASPPLVLDDLPLELHGSRMSDIGPEVPADAFEGRVAGTVGYVDPECVRLGLPANAQSDLYSLGALLYECITGYLPAVAGRPRGSGLSGAVLDGREAPPRIATIDDNLGRFRGPIGLLVDSLVSPSRSTRPHSAQTVAETIWVIARANDPPRHHLFLRDRVIPITPGGFVIGRGSRCDLPLKDDEASRLHAAIHVNGPRRNSRRLGKHERSPGEWPGGWRPDCPRGCRHHTSWCDDDDYQGRVRWRRGGLHDDHERS
jgi:serine/threonine protein kinase